MSSVVDTKTRGRRARQAGQPDSMLRLRRRQIVDRLAAWFMRLGGGLIILCILGILVFLLNEVLPLWRGAQVRPVHGFSISSEHGMPLAVGLDEHQQVAYLVRPLGRIEFVSLVDGRPAGGYTAALDSGVTITSAWQSLRLHRLALASSDGRVLEMAIDFGRKQGRDTVRYKPEAAEVEHEQLDPEGRAIVSLAFAGDPESGSTSVGITTDGRLLMIRKTVSTSLFGPSESTSSRYDLTDQLVGVPTVVEIDEGQENLYVGTDDGRLIHFDLSDAENPKRIAVIRGASEDDSAITALAFLIGDQSLVVGDASGGVNVWFKVRDETAPTGWRLRRIHRLEPHHAPITAIAASARNKGLISSDAAGRVYLDYATNERDLAKVQAADTTVRLLAFAPKANGFLALDGSARLRLWAVDNPHPEASWRAFFGKIWYEGYPEPEYVWQSTGGSDEFEPKFSLIPLIFGTLKGTFYSLIIAVPLAILAALYTSQFMHPRWRNRVKPTLEIMAALPSVILGFLAGLWLAPVLSEYFPALLVAVVVVPLVILLSSAVWRLLPPGVRGRFAPGIEAWVLLPLIAIVLAACLQLNHTLGGLLFSGDFKSWLFESLGWRYDQRNALVVGFAMGFAVIPIIYTISEDALSNVPTHLVAASLAIGATRWQTAVRVVLPTASAGIFSAVMIGFGRAVGETMIVLMATGNTPIMDLSMFNGFRTLSANIAVEVPEAPVGGTLYRVLFLSAVLLFLLTFVLNTVAEIVRQRVRERYGKL